MSNSSRDTQFQWVIWTIFALENWILDFGRPIAMVTLRLNFQLNKVTYKQKNNSFLAGFSSRMVSLE